MAMDPWRQDQASARAGLRKAAAEAAGRGGKLRLDPHTAALILRATGAAELDGSGRNLGQAAAHPWLTGLAGAWP